MVKSVGKVLTLDKKKPFEKEMEIRVKVRVTNIMSMTFHTEFATGKDGKIEFDVIQSLGGNLLRMEYGDRLIDVRMGDVVDAMAKQVGRVCGAKEKKI